MARICTGELGPLPQKLSASTNSSRLLKQLVYNTNKQKPERDIMRLLNQQVTTRLVLQRCFETTEPELTKQMLAVQVACPGLFDRLLPRSERSEAIDESREELDILSDVTHINIRGMSTSSLHCFQH